MSSVRIFQLILLLVLALAVYVGRTVLVMVDVHRLKGQTKNRYTAGVAAITSAPAVPLAGIGLIILLLPWALRGLGLEKLGVNPDDYAWIFHLLGWVLLVPAVLLVLYNLSKRIRVEKGTATFTRWFFLRETVKLKDIDVVKERFRRHHAGVLPVYQCVYDVYIKGEDGVRKKVYTLSNTMGGLRFLRDVADVNKVEWAGTTPKRYSRNPVIFPSLQQLPIPKGSDHQELYLLTIPTLLTRQMINNNLPDVDFVEVEMETNWEPPQADNPEEQEEKPENEPKPAAGKGTEQELDEKPVAEPKEGLVEKLKKRFKAKPNGEAKGETAPSAETAKKEATGEPETPEAMAE